MKRFCTSVFFLFLFNTLSSFAQKPGTDFDVRSVKWWMTKEQVLAAEKGRKPTQQSRERLLYEGVKLDDDIANLLYEFHSNKLVSLTFIFSKLGNALYVPYLNYSLINRQMMERYGEPVKNDEQWRRYKNIYKPVVGYSDAIANGDLALYTIWAGRRTAIVHSMNSKAHRLSYTSQVTPKPASGIR